jgi:carbonic anhydrase/acetyltransferase-like protein (isoleucine patch superfamily)
MRGNTMTPDSLMNYPDFWRGNLTPSCEQALFIADSADIIGDVRLGKDSSIWYQSVLRADTGPIIIGEGTNIQDGSAIHTSKNQPTVVGDYTTVAHHVILHSATIGNHCLIGIGAIILDGAIIGDHCIVAAGSLVTPGTVIEPYSMVMGKPGKKTRSLNQQDIAFITKNTQGYIQAAQFHLIGIERYRADKNKR